MGNTSSADARRSTHLGASHDSPHPPGHGSSASAPNHQASQGHIQNMNNRGFKPIVAGSSTSSVSTQPVDGSNFSNPSSAINSRRGSRHDIESDISEQHVENVNNSVLPTTANANDTANTTNTTATTDSLRSPQSPSLKSPPLAESSSSFHVETAESVDPLTDAQTAAAAIASHLQPKEPPIQFKQPFDNTITASSSSRSEFSHIENVAPSSSSRSSSSRSSRLRRKSTLLLDHDANVDVDEDVAFESLKLSSGGNSHQKLQEPSAAKPLSRVGSGEEVELTGVDYTEGKFPVRIQWRRPGAETVYVTGSFTGWRKMIKLHRDEAEEKKNKSTEDGNNIPVFVAVLNLPPGTHRMRFVVNNELCCSDDMATATDSMGNLVNYIEIGTGMDQEFQGVSIENPVGSQKAADSSNISPNGSPTSPTSNNDNAPTADDDVGDGYERFTGEDFSHANYEYTNEIPALFTDQEIMEQYLTKDITTPPSLPPHLESVILNSSSTEKDNNSVLPIPNHVILNHLATTSIKHNVLAVASVSRYSRKYVTQILYSPLS